MDSAIDGELIRTLADFAGLEIPADDVELVAGHLANVLSGSEQLARLQLSDVEPIVTFDPRWH
jgi:Asp-tRNA(Asn)/Glu-tRNA(Gln) amidotransferase C subunit